MQTINDVPMILRREIEARMIAPFLDAFEAELGEEKTRAIAEKVIAKQATEAGEATAKEFQASGEKDPLVFFKDTVTPRFGLGGGIQYEFPEHAEKRLRMDVTYCRYADLYKSLGLEKYGMMLSCMRDVYMIPAIDKSITFSRTKTRMEGCDVCDFCLDIAD